jgi:hypothetical protein
MLPYTCAKTYRTSAFLSIREAISEPLHDEPCDSIPFHFDYSRSALFRFSLRFVPSGGDLLAAFAGKGSKSCGVNRV